MYYNTLPAGQSYKQQTYVGHPWLVCVGPEQSPVSVFHPLHNDAHALITPSLLNQYDIAFGYPTLKHPNSPPNGPTGPFSEGTELIGDAR